MLLVPAILAVPRGCHTKDCSALRRPAPNRRTCTRQRPIIASRMTFRRLDVSGPIHRNANTAATLSDGLAVPRLGFPGIAQRIAAGRAHSRDWPPDRRHCRNGPLAGTTKQARNSRTRVGGPGSAYGAAGAPADARAIRDRLRRMTLDLHGTLERDVDRARDVLRELPGGVALVREEDAVYAEIET